MTTFLLGCAFPTPVTVDEPRTDRDTFGVVIDSPGDGDVVSGRVTVEASILGSLDVREATVTLDGDSLGTLTEPPWTWTWESSRVADSTTTVCAKARTADGREERDTIELRVAHQPTVEWVTPQNGDELGDERTPFDVRAYAPDGIARIELLVDGQTVDEVEGDTFSKSKAPCPESGPEMTLTARATSVLGAVAEESIVVTRLYALGVQWSARDFATSPETTVSVAVATGGPVASVAWAFDDEVVAVQTEATGSIDTCSSCALACLTFETTLGLALVPEGEHPLVVTVTDAALDTVSASLDLTLARDEDDDGRESYDWGGRDCDDARATVYDEAPELCDGLDNDCDGVVDDDCSDTPALPDGWETTEGATVLVGDGPDAGVGLSLAAGDFNGDGLDDLLVGADYWPGYPSWRGAVHFLAGPLGRDTTVDGIDDVRVEGTTTEEFLGSGVSLDADFDGDGLADALVVGRFGGSGAYTWLLPGARVGAGTVDEVAFAISDSGAYWRGLPLGGSGDVDGDGRDDLVAADPAAESGGLVTGAFSIFITEVDGDRVPGDADARLWGSATSSIGAMSALGGDDYDGDGLHDVLVPGAQDEGSGATGVIFLVTGAASTSTIDDAYAHLDGNAAAAKEIALAGIGDANADGYADFAVGVPEDNTAAAQAGVVHVVHGPVAAGAHGTWADATLLGENAWEQAGRELGVHRDDDGTADLLVGVPSASGIHPGAGVVYRVPLPITGTSSLGDVEHRLVSTDDDAALGTAVLGSHDLDGDGVPDLAVGEPGYWSYSGAVFLFSAP